MTCLPIDAGCVGAYALSPGFMRWFVIGNNEATKPVDARLRRKEFIIFLLLAFGIWPIVAIAFVGSYGFLVWMLQIVFGPPGPPPGGIL